MRDRLAAELERIVGKRGVLHSTEELAVYGYDGTFLEHRPDLVVLPETTEQVSQVVALAARERVPVVPRGMGSGLSAASVPFGGGIALVLTRMNRILEIDERNSAALVQAGIITADLQTEVEKHDLFYPPDPSSNRHSTIGGNVACNAGGPRCLKYGVTGDYVMGLTVVLADGRVLRTGNKAIKNAVGYNMTRLFIGSEGTLGVITEALLRLVARPRHARTALAEFESLDDASRAINAILQAGILPVALELMDETAIACIEEAMGLGLPLDVEASLILETDGSDEPTVVREIEAAAELCRRLGARDVKIAGNEDERASLWKARRAVSPSLARKAAQQAGRGHHRPPHRHSGGHPTHQGHQRPARAAHRGVRPRRRRESPPKHPLRQARPGPVGEGREDGRRAVRRSHGTWRLTIGRARGRSAEATLRGAGPRFPLRRDAAADQGRAGPPRYPQPGKAVTWVERYRLLRNEKLHRSTEASPQPRGYTWTEFEP